MALGPGSGDGDDGIAIESLLRDVSFNRHSIQDGDHISPFDQARWDVGIDNIKVRLVQGLDERSFREVLGRATQATTGIDPDNPPDALPWEEMFKGGLQTALETQVVVFEVSGVSRACTHQLVRTRRAAFHQQSQRATWMGSNPNTRIPRSVADNPKVLELFEAAMAMAHSAYRAACEADIAYQDARFVLPEGTETYILCEYPLAEFLKTYAYRACYMFLWEITYVFWEMKRVLVEAHPWLEPYIKVSCEAGKVCTFQGWENVEERCPLPWARQDNRTYLPDPKLRIEKKPVHRPGIGKPKWCEVCDEYWPCAGARAEGFAE